MRSITIILFLVFFAGKNFVCEGQTIERFNSFSYSVNEGLLQSTISDFAFDKNNFCWLSFPNGIQKFDGKKFIDVALQTGLPDDKQVKFFRSSDGDLFLSHSQGISKYEIVGNRFMQVYRRQPSLKTPALFIGEDDNIIYFYTENGKIAELDSRTFKIAPETKTSFPDYSFNSDYLPKFSDNIINHKVALLINSSLYLWDLQKRKLLFRSNSIPDISAYMLRLKTESEVLYCNYKINNALHLYNFTTGTNKVLLVKGKDNENISRCVIFPWHDKTLISFSNKLYETDTTLLALKSEVVNFQNQAIAGKSVIARIKEDNFGNLCIATISNGIKKIIRNNYPIKYYGTDDKENNFIMSLLPDKKNNRILAGAAGNGLLVFDTLQRLIKHIRILPGERLSFSPNAIIKTNEGDYLLFISGEKNVWRLSSDFSKMKRIPFSTSLPQNKSGISYFGNFLFQNDREAVIQSQGKLYKTSFNANAVTEYEITNAYTMSGLLHNNIIITHANDELIFLDTSTFKKIKRIPFKNTGNVRCFAKPARPAGGDGANNIYVGSNKGIFTIDPTGKILLHLNKEKGLPDECIYAMVFDNNGQLWCSTNKGIFSLNKDNSIFQLTKEDGLQENEFNTNVVAKAGDGEIFFGGVNGVSSFFPSAINRVEENINLVVTSIKINNREVLRDSAVWNISDVVLPYNQNSLAFDFIAMSNNNPDQYIYQYKMKGVDEEWIRNSNLQTVRYFLPPGNYIFQMAASRFFDKNAKAMKEIHITINQPFWKSWWFLTALSALLVFVMIYGINQYNRRKYQKKVALLESENKLRQERERISRDLHDSIGAYANAVLYKTELLQQEEHPPAIKDVISDLRFASKDIITSLRETIWALKQDHYSAEDCILRIRNFIQPFTRYYRHIKFKVEGEAPSAKILHHDKALHLVRIVQEAVSNAIKHGEPKNIIITTWEENNSWIILVKDDGKGFSPGEEKRKSQGNGLENMEQRAFSSGLILKINSHPGHGTSITIIS